MEAPRKCKIDDCELNHCLNCGNHWDAATTRGGSVCDACQIWRASSEAEAMIRNFDGNYEAAARFYGW